MITKEVREFILAPINTLYSERPKELGFTPFNVDNSLEDVDEWANKVKEIRSTIKLTFEDSLEYIAQYEQDEIIKKQLEDLCIKATEEALGFKFEDLKLRGSKVEAKPQLIPTTKFDKPEKEKEDKGPVEFNESFRLHSNRRRVLHGITACAGLSAGVNLHHLVTRELSEIDPKLLDSYDVIGLRTLQDTYTINPMSVYMMYKAGEDKEIPIQNSCDVDVEEDENEEQTLNVQSQAISFNMLLHETVKGVLNLFTILNIPQDLYEDEDQLAIFYKESDKLTEEYFHFMCSMHMYKELNQFCIDKQLNFIDVFKQLNICEPEHAIEFLMCLHEDEPEDLEFIYDMYIANIKDEYENN